jgi:3-methyladenine DNA glycosylase AlkC
MGLIKDIYSNAFYETFSGYLGQSLPAFDKKVFLKAIFTADFKDMEWKQRMKHTTAVLHQVLPKEFPEAVKKIEMIIDLLRTDAFGEDSLAFVIFPDYIETYGLDDFKTSAKAFEFITQFVSCEFAVRPFILKYGDWMIDRMIKWSQHKNYKVRRLSSEGSRPRLPWAMAIPALKEDPRPLLPLLENLKADPSDWVRKSVANNINDISKDHPDIVLALAKKWRGVSRETDAIIKHGCRTLLKQGHTEILSEYNLDARGLSVGKFRIITPEVTIGDSLEFSFELTNNNKTAKTVRLEYGVYYRKSNGQLSKKVFKISEKEYEPQVTIKVFRKQSFKLITTRKFYPGEHQLSIIINGKEQALVSFGII